MWFWNRKEIYHGFSMKEFGDIRDKLSLGKFKYDYKVVDMNSSGVFSSNRARYGSFGLNNNFVKEYYLYVHKNSYDNAIYLIHHNN